MSEFDGMSRTRSPQVVTGRDQITKAYEVVLRDDGLVIARPRRIRSALDFPAKSAAIVLASMLLFKGILIASLGPIGYDERVVNMKDNSILERLGAIVLVSDPVSREIGTQLAPVFR